MGIEVLSTGVYRSAGIMTTWLRMSRALAGEIEVRMLGEVQDRVFVGGGRVFQLQGVIVRQGVNGGDGQRPRDNLLPRRG